MTQAPNQTQQPPTQTPTWTQRRIAAPAVPFQDLGRLHASIDTELRAAIDDVVARSGFVGAKASAAFEADFAAAHRVDHAVGVGSGTDALALGLRALGVGPGDEVIVPAMTFVASAEAVVHAGATPVIVDVEPDTLLIDPTAVEAAVTDRTKAVMPVHLYGTPVSFDVIAEWRSAGLAVIEDAAQAHLATWQDRSVGTAGDLACFSFYPGKNLGGFGDGGAVITTNPELAARVAKLRDHGRTTKYGHDEIGWCSRLDGLQAAVLQVKLRHLAEWTAQRRLLADRYRERLGAALIDFAPGSVHHLMVWRAGSARRDAMLDHLRAHDVGCGVHFPMALTQQPALQRWAGAAPAAEAAAAEILSLPMDPLMKLSDVEYVCDTIDAYS